jgi:hypothetical protein
MTRLIALLIITVVASFSCAAPAAATSCDLTNNVLAVRATIADLAQDADRANAVSRHIHNTSRSRPYKSVESDWADVKQRTSDALEKLTDIIIALDPQPDDAQKSAAENLASAYQSSLRNIVNSARSALYLERTENAVSMNRWTGYLNYSVPKAPAEVNTHAFAREQEEKYNDSGEDALRSLKLPEHLYGKACGKTFPPFRNS